MLDDKQVLENMVEKASSLSAVLALRAEAHGSEFAFHFLPDGESIACSITFEELHLKSRLAASYIRSKTQQGDRVLLLFNTGIDFVIAFYGCMYAGVTAVPSSLPSLNQAARRISSIHEDCQPSLILAAEKDVDRLNKKLADSDLIAGTLVEALDMTANTQNCAVQFPEKTPVFLQYTSGSTSMPKGVRVTMSALVQNSQMTRDALHFDRGDRIISWLPIFHDMGLMSSIIQPVFVGATAYLIPPASFVQKPICWLEAVTRFEGTIIGGPDFGYRLCLEKINDEQKKKLNLSTIKTAFNGAEPIRATTINDFSKSFENVGFNKRSFLPCYGMAETVVFVSGSFVEQDDILSLNTEALSNGVVSSISRTMDRKGASDKDVVELPPSGSMHFGDQKVVIVNPETKEETKENCVGEIWVSGTHIADGYWDKPEVSDEIFNAKLDAYPDRKFLRTGDLGFIKNDLLYICGRLKDLIILRGKNYYPQDIEYAAENAHTDVRSPGFAAAFSDGDAEDRLILVIEVERTARRRLDSSSVGQALANAVAEATGLKLSGIQFIRFNSIPRTTSGKIQRAKAKQMYQTDKFEVCGRWNNTTETSMSSKASGDIREIICGWLNMRLGVVIEEIDDDAQLSIYGVDSILAVELSQEIEKYSNTNVDVEVIYDNPTVNSLVAALSEYLDKEKLGTVELDVRNSEVVEEPQRRSNTNAHVLLPTYRTAKARKTQIDSKKPIKHVVLADFKPWRSNKYYSQENTLDYIAWMTSATECYKNQVNAKDDAEAIHSKNQELVNRYGVKPEAIAYRQLNVFPPSLTGNGDAPEFPLTHSNLDQDYCGLSLEKRMAHYNEFVLSVMDDWYSAECEGPSDIVHVTCSGYLSPSPAQRLVSTKQWLNTSVTHSYHMGCYGAFPGLRIASGVACSHQALSQTEGRIDVLHTEYLSVHFDFTRHDPGHLIDMTLFSDGFIRYSVYSEEQFNSENKAGLKLFATHEELIPESLEEMTWTPGSHQFGMYLSKNVPLFIRDAIPQFTETLCLKAGIDFSKEKDKLLFAVHPGGPKILDHIQDVLGLTSYQIDFGRKILRQFGNMSSATIPHIWQSILEDNSIPAGTKIVSMAFGPGLTATGAVLEKI